MKRFLAPVLAVLMAFACSGDVPTEATTDAVFAKGGAAPPVEIVSFEVDKPAASYLEEVVANATLQVNKLKPHEIVWVRYKIAGLTDFRNGYACGEVGRPSPCEFDVKGLCTYTDVKPDVLAWFGQRLDGEGIHAVSAAGPAGDLCLNHKPDPVAGDYELVLEVVVWDLNNQKKRGLVRSEVDFTLLD